MAGDAVSSYAGYRPYTQARRPYGGRPDPLGLLSGSRSPMMVVGEGGEPPAAPPTAAPPAAPPAAAPTAQPPTTDTGWENDPILQRIKALAASNVASAEAQATASRKQLAIQFGDPGLAKSLGLGALTETAAQNNPFSILAGLTNQHVGRAAGLDESLNKGNLFYSSTRGADLGAEGRQYLGERAGAASAVQNQLSMIAAALLAAKQNAAAQVLSGQEGAYGRGLANPPDVVPAGEDPQTYQDAKTAYAALQALLHGQPADTSLLSPTTILRALGG